MNQSGLTIKMQYIGSLLAEKKAYDVLALDVSALSSAFEGIVMATAQGHRHAKSLADHILNMGKEKGLEYLGMEGYQEGEWILLDLNDVIVHIFMEETRVFYNLEGFWTRAKKVNLKQNGDTHDSSSQ